jgi:hypothetical protein
MEEIPRRPKAGQKYSTGFLAEKKYREARCIGGRACKRYPLGSKRSWVVFRVVKALTIKPSFSKNSQNYLDYCYEHGI